MSESDVVLKMTASYIRRGALYIKPAPLDVERLHRALWAVGESELRYVIDEGKYLEAASSIAREYDRLADHQSVAGAVPGLPVNWPSPSTNTPNVDEHPLEHYWSDREKA